ncbi:hypothetical protein Tco_0033941 [Tanacetum coccineum]
MYSCYSTTIIQQVVVGGETKLEDGERKEEEEGGGESEGVVQRGRHHGRNACGDFNGDCDTSGGYGGD